MIKSFSREKLCNYSDSKSIRIWSSSFRFIFKLKSFFIFSSKCFRITLNCDILTVSSQLLTQTSLVDIYPIGKMTIAREIVGIKSKFIIINLFKLVVWRSRKKTSLLRRFELQLNADCCATRQNHDIAQQCCGILLRIIIERLRRASLSPSALPLTHPPHSKEKHKFQGIHNCIVFYIMKSNYCVSTLRWDNSDWCVCDGEFEWRTMDGKQCAVNCMQRLYVSLKNNSDDDGDLKGFHYIISNTSSPLDWIFDTFSSRFWHRIKLHIKLLTACGWKKWFHNKILRSICLCRVHRSEVEFEHSLENIFKSQNRCFASYIGMHKSNKDDTSTIHFISR